MHNPFSSDKNNVALGASKNNPTGADELPPVNEQAGLNSADSTIKDKAGNLFNKNKHKVGSDGQPVFTKSGLFSKTGRNTGSAGKDTNTIDNGQSTLAARFVSSMIERLQVIGISTDFEYTKTEREHNVKNWEAAIDHYGGMDVHPVAALMADHVAIIAIRVKKEKTKAKIGRLAAWWQARKDRKLEKIEEQKKDETAEATTPPAAQESTTLN